MSQTSSEKVRWTTADLELLAADEWKRYEIIDGELFVTKLMGFKPRSSRTAFLNFKTSNEFP